MTSNHKNDFEANQRDANIGEKEQLTPDRKESALTERSQERKKENEEYVPVIIKRSDEARRHPDDTLLYAVQEGVEQLGRSLPSLALSAVAAGLILGFTAMSVAIASKLAAEAQLSSLSRVAVAAVYPLGFVMCVLSGTQLFTEHTATAVYPLLDRKARFTHVLRLWAVVIVGNFVGTAISAALLAAAEPVVQAREGYALMAEHLVGVEPIPLLASSLLAGWLMALGGWLMLGSSNATGQMLSIYIVTFLIGLGGFHHSIAGSAELFTAQLITGEPTWEQGIRFLGFALLGNLLGGSLFVGALNYAQIRGTQQAAKNEAAASDHSHD